MGLFDDLYDLYSVVGNAQQGQLAGADVEVGYVQRVAVSLHWARLAPGPFRLIWAARG